MEKTTSEYIDAIKRLAPRPSKTVILISQEEFNKNRNYHRACIYLEKRGFDLAVELKRRPCFGNNEETTRTGGTIGRTGHQEKPFKS